MRISSASGTVGVSPRSACLICPNSQGLPRAPRPMAMPSAPVWFSSTCAFWGVNTSPLAMTGILTACFTWAMTPQSARPAYCCCRVRPCTHRLSAPAASHILAKSTALMWLLSQPMRILTDSGLAVALRTARIICSLRARFFISALPLPEPVTLGAGQPKLRSMPLYCGSRDTRAAAPAIMSGWWPNSWMVRLRSRSWKASRCW